MSSNDLRLILVTGGAGYVGAHVYKALAARVYRPVVYDTLVHGREAAVKWGRSKTATLPTAHSLTR